MAKRENPKDIELRRQFDVAIETNLGPKATIFNVDAIEELTPEWEMYDDDDGKECIPDAPEIETAPTLEAGDNNVYVNIMLSREDSMARGRVISHKRDAEGNLMGNTSANLILESREYEVQ